MAELSLVAERHGLPLDAVETLIDALRRGGGRQAQFSHPALGGMGQWSSGGGIMIGDMFNHALKAKVATLCDELARQVESAAIEPVASARAWWPNGLGRPSAPGRQNDHVYACFPETRRLALRDGAGIRLFDTGEHHISGVSQQQSGMRDLVFTSQHGPVRLSDLICVPQEAGTEAADPVPPASHAEYLESSPGSADVIGLIERIHTLERKGVVTKAEYEVKKTELLGRL